MLIRFSRHCSKAWLTAMMVVMLLGGQLLQHSALHDHARETVDCALCHLQSLGDDSELTHGLPPVVKQAGFVVDFVDTSTTDSHFPSPYQGRAPPTTSL